VTNNGAVEWSERMPKCLGGGIVLLQLVRPPAATGQPAPTHAATPVDPIAAIVEAFRTPNVVTLTDPHDNVQVQTFLLSLIRDPRFPDAANDIVIETASARYQDAIDRFVRGDDVEAAVFAKGLGRPYRGEQPRGPGRRVDSSCACRQRLPQKHVGGQPCLVTT
jgi:hypothetical protein